jgi:hypothetical protein
MLKKIGLSTMALLAVLIWVEPASVLAEGREGSRARYSDTRGDRHDHEFRDHERFRDRDRRDRDNRDRDRDRDWRRHDDDDWCRYNSLHR